MRKLLAVVIAVASLVLAASANASVRAAYFAGWDIYGRGYTPQQIPADRLNTIFYAFAKPDLQPDGSVLCAPGDAWADYETPYLTSDLPAASVLLQECRRQLDAAGAATGTHYLLTADLPAGNVNAARFELPAATGALDWVNLLTLDYHGSWDSTTDFNSPFSLDPFEP